MDILAYLNGRRSAKAGEVAFDDDSLFWFLLGRQKGASGPMPAYIRITTPPTKTEYVDGDTIDFTGLVVTAYNEDDTPFTDRGWTNGDIPNNLLTFPVTVAHYEEGE